MSRVLTASVVSLVLTSLLALTTLQSAAAENKTDQPEITVQFANWEETLKIVAGHKGKIVVLDAWSTTCEPCKEEFPNLVKLHNRHGNAGVACLSLACDFSGIKNRPPEYYKERVLKFLTKQKATFQNLISTVPADDLYDAMQISSIPVVYVFGRDGKLVKRFDNEKAEKEEDNFTYEDVTKLVEELLAKKK